MKIHELDGQYAKVSKSSITVKDDQNKTIGVITQCHELSPRDSSSIWGKVRKAVGLDATSCIAKMRKIGNQIFYLENVNTPDKCVNALREAGIMVVRYRGL